MNHLKFEGKYLHLTYNDKEYIIKTVDDWVAAGKDIQSQPNSKPESFICASSIDFPEEYTDSKELIELCYKIRSN